MAERDLYTVDVGGPIPSGCTKFNMKKKYSDQQVIEAVAANISIAGVMRSLGMSQNSSSSHTHLSKRIRALHADTSHFLGLRANCGVNHKGGRKFRTPQEILILKTSGDREKAVALRRALIKIGRKEECECGLGLMWRGKSIVLQIEHINGNNLDDRPENLTFLCPNCHSQTATWGSRKFKYAGVAKLAAAAGREPAAP